MLGRFLTKTKRRVGQRGVKRRDPVKSPGCSEFEVDATVLSWFVVKRLVRRVGFRPFPINELLLMTSAVCRIRPEMILEWGTNIGVSASVFFEACKYFGIRAEIHSTDLPADVEHVENPGSRRGELVRGLPNVHLHLGDGLTTSLQIYRASGSRGPVLFFIDGDHEYESVKRELEGVYAAVPRATVLVHDTFYQQPQSGYNVGPWKAVTEVVRSLSPPPRRLSTDVGLPGMTLLYFPESTREAGTGAGVVGLADVPATGE